MSELALQIFWKVLLVVGAVSVGLIAASIGDPVGIGLMAFFALCLLLLAIFTELDV